MKAKPTEQVQLLDRQQGTYSRPMDTGYMIEGDAMSTCKP
jgi:hypothetical protein